MRKTEPLEEGTMARFAPVIAGCVGDLLSLVTL